LAECIPDGRPFVVEDEIIAGFALKQCDFAIQFAENGFWVAFEAGVEFNVDNGFLG
jgi:non-canonical (house-cleaning) NTP pyrophosphatase